MIYPKIPLAQSVIEICKSKGIQHIVISPGSRNAPLTIGFTNNPFFKCYSIVDERCAAFFALGIAQQLQEPVALVCTSGSALLNYYPAFAEAFYSQIPLVVLSADRPHDKIDIGDGQTIRQENVFANHSLYNANLLEDVSSENDQEINEALNAAITKSGPVHINVPFEEPLYDVVEILSVSPNIIPPKNEILDFKIAEIQQQKWSSAKKKMIVVGELKPKTLTSEIIEYFAKDNSVVVLIEKNSNLYHDTFVSKIDTLITPFTEDDFKQFQPEILVTFGGLIVSKRIKAFLRKYQPSEHWHIDTIRAYNTFGCLTHHFKTHPNSFFKELDTSKLVDSTYKSDVLSTMETRNKKHQEYLATVSYSDFSIFQKLTALLPKNIQLQISNSSAVRYLQLFDLDTSVSVYCNRGTSGIDGSTSTAIGAALVSSIPTVFITGDISFFYDSNALWNNYIPDNFKIIIINNGGGGIFRILPGHKETSTFNTYFETSHQLNAKHLAAMFDFDYQSIDSESDLEKAILQFFQKSTHKSILEIFTPEKINNKVLLDYFKNLK